ncbi:MAG: B12-binding domain-containing radical SAM protein [Candidatus Sumerlaeaceae bacterium]|nr:B12-binding domain-containing radical SAM protein [Candidatus Sumerlaeaceae bacterium]
MKSLRFQRVVFLEPRSTHIHVYSKVRIPRIGSLLLSTMLRQAGHDVAVIVEDMLRKRVTENDVWRRIREADLLCVSAITPTVGRCYEWCDRARAAGIPVILGGTHGSYFPDEAMTHADYVMRGECDESFPLLMETLEAGGDLAKVPGLSWRAGVEVRHNPEGKLPTSAVLEANPFPDYELLWQTDLRGGVGSFAAARGCPFDCSFCSVTKFNGGQVRVVSPQRTLDMIEEHWLRYKPHYIFFAEDIFNLLKPRAKEIMRGLIERRIRPRVGFGAQMRHEVAKDPEFLQLMKRAGFDRAMVGFESINQASLDLCGKREKVDHVRHALQEFHRHGIKVHGMFVAGFDTDTPETFSETLKFVKKFDLDSFQLMVLTPFPGTRDWVNQGFADGTRPLLTKDWSRFDGHHMVQTPKLMTAFEANSLALRTMQKFYTLRGAFWRLLRGDLVEFIMRLEGRKLVHEWFKASTNRDYLAMLKRQVTPDLGKWDLAAAKRRIIIAHTEASIALKGQFDRFFAELGIRVEHSRAGLGEMLTQGQSQLQGLQSKMAEFLPDWRLFPRERADLIIVPEDSGGEMDLKVEEMGTGAPLLLRININKKASVLMTQVVKIATGFTDDLRRATEAYRRTIVEPTATAW